jgi:hypothetical protein
MALRAGGNRVHNLSKEPEMERNLEDLEVVDLGDAKELTKGDHSLVKEEDNGGFIYRP